MTVDDGNKDFFPGLGNGIPFAEKVVWPLRSGKGATGYLDTVDISRHAKRVRGVVHMDCDALTAYRRRAIWGHFLVPGACPGWGCEQLREYDRSG